MDSELLTKILYVSAPVLFAVVAYFMRSYLARLENIEKIINYKLDESQVRTLLSDKLDPIREDILDLKVKLDKIVDILINK